MHPVAYVLTVSGSDSSGCAGLQADNRAIHAAGAMPLNVLTATTLQTPDGLLATRLADPAEVEQGITSLLEAYPVRTVKIGMLGSAAIVEAVARALADSAERPFVVLDPVLQTSSGSALLDPAGVEVLNGQLLPLAGLVTPNLPERRQLRVPDSVAVLLKGGHADSAECVDQLTLPDGQTLEFSAARVDTLNTRGTGCALSAGIAAYLAQGSDLPTACQLAKSQLHDSLSRHADQRFTGPGPSFLPGANRAE